MSASGEAVTITPEERKMNATEQIALLRRACERSLKAIRFKWDPPSMDDVMAVDGLLREALSATATPPDDDVATLREALGMLTTLHGGMPIDVSDPVGMARSIHAHVTEVIDTRTKERDEALAKLAAKEKELADIYAAPCLEKPEQQFRAVTGIVEKRGWVEFAKCETWDDAKRIADALNGGGK